MMGMMIFWLANYMRQLLLIILVKYTFGKDLVLDRLQMEP